MRMKGFETWTIEIAIEDGSYFVPKSACWGSQYCAQERVEYRTNCSFKGMTIPYEKGLITSKMSWTLVLGHTWLTNKSTGMRGEAIRNLN